MNYFVSTSAPLSSKPKVSCICSSRVCVLICEIVTRSFHGFPFLQRVENQPNLFGSDSFRDSIEEIFIYINSFRALLFKRQVQFNTQSSEDVKKLIFNHGETNLGPFCPET